MIGGNEVTRASFSEETLSMLSTIVRDKASYSEKASELVFKIFKGEKSKSVGMIALNLAEYIDDNSDNFKRVKVPIQKCPDKNASLEFSIRAKFISILSAAGDTMSMMSGLESMSIDSGPETEFEFNTDLVVDVPRDIELDQISVADQKASGVQIRRKRLPSAQKRRAQIDSTIAQKE